MKKLLIIFCLSTIFLACKDDCKNPTLCSMSETDVAYFGNFHSDYSWEYVSQRGVRDYISIHNYMYEWSKPEAPDCNYVFRSSMNVNSRHLGFNRAGFHNYSCDFRHFILFSSKENTLHFITNPDNDYYQDAIIIDSLKVLKTTYKNVLFKDRIWLAPGIGIVQFVSKNTIDTFYFYGLYKNEI